MRGEGDMQRDLTVAVHREEDGSVWGEVAELPGCFASGRDLDEFWEAIAEAISLYLSEPDAPVTAEISERRQVGSERVEQHRVLVDA